MGNGHMAAGSVISGNGGLIAGGAALIAVAIIAGMVLTGEDSKTGENSGAKIAAPAGVAVPGDPAVSSPVAQGAAPEAMNNDAAKTDPTDATVSATVVGETVVASNTPPSAVPQSGTSATKPAVGTVAPGLAAGTVPVFELVRVDKAGAAIVAGKSAPGAAVEVVLNGAVVATIKADNRGNFVAMFDVPPKDQPQTITLQAQDPSGQMVVSEDSVFVVGPEAGSVVAATPATNDAAAQTDTAAAGDSGQSDAAKPATGDNSMAAAVAAAAATASDPQAPAIVIAGKSGVKLMQPPSVAGNAPEAMANVSLDLITYDDQGEVLLAGRGGLDQHVRVYVNDRPVKTELVNPDGAWQMTLPEVDPGTYTLRVDELDASGKVTSRLETPFRKENPEDVKRVASATAPSHSDTTTDLPKIDKITIQPGATLWALAKANYGDGRLYMQIFDANRTSIRNPNLIYPGQIFTIPD